MRQSHVRYFTAERVQTFEDEWQLSTSHREPDVTAFFANTAVVLAMFEIGDLCCILSVLNAKSGENFHGRNDQTFEVADGPYDPEAAQT